MQHIDFRPGTWFAIAKKFAMKTEAQPEVEQTVKQENVIPKKKKKPERPKGVKRLHPWHLVTPSPWPLFVSLIVLFVVFGFLRYVHFFFDGLEYLLCPLVLLPCILFLWWRDVIRESKLGFHSESVKASLRFGFVLFIASEVMFFFGIFCTLFYYKLSPEIQIGAVWPPEAIFTLNPLDVPFLNTLILVTSGVAITVVHHDIVINSVPHSATKISKTFRPRKSGWIPFRTPDFFLRKKLYALANNNLLSSLMFVKSRKGNSAARHINWFRIKISRKFVSNFFHHFYFSDTFLFFSITLILAFAFTGLQLQEYWEASFQIRTSVYGSIFYFSTGFHGLHVLLGSIFLLVCFIRFIRFQLKPYPFPFSDGFWMAIWYWHFVDIVWLGLYFFLYLWGEKLEWSDLFDDIVFIFKLFP